MFFRVCLGIFLLAGRLIAEEIENLALAAEVSYQIYPGKWHHSLLTDKNLGALIDNDWDRENGQRKNMLVNGKTLESAIRYNYHSALAAERFMVIEFDLGKPATIQEVKIFAFKNNSLYEMRKVQLESSLDHFVFKQNGVADLEQIQLEKNIYRAELRPLDSDMRILRLYVWCRSWINVTEVEIWGTWQ